MRIPFRLFAAVAVLGLSSCVSPHAHDGTARTGTTPPASQAAPTGIRTRAQHEQVAAAYEEEARTAQSRAAAHRRMLTLYAAPYADYNTTGFVGHCQNLIRQYDDVAKEALELAGLHRRLAAQQRD